MPGVGGGPATNQTFVQALYVQLLNRQGGASEISSWVSVIPSLGRAGVARTLLGSAEYRGIVVRSYYTLLLHRLAPPAQAEVDGWVNSGFDLGSIRLGFESSLEFFLNG